jgi:5-methylcytosine-specific restriction endonuclease McrA
MTNPTWPELLSYARFDQTEWWRVYGDYLGSPEWEERRRLVLDRAGGACEGCRCARATQVHHKTYRHVGAEFLWELVAICNDCHQRLHPRMAAEDYWAAAEGNRP